MNEPFAVEARDDYLRKENGPDTFKIQVLVQQPSGCMLLYAKPGVETGQTAWRWRRFL